MGADACPVPMRPNRAMEKSQTKVITKLRIRPDLHRALRLMAAERGMSMSAVASEIFYREASRPGQFIDLNVDATQRRHGN